MGITRRRSRRWLIVVAHRLGMDVLTVRCRRHGMIRFRCPLNCHRSVSGMFATKSTTFSD